MTEPVPVELEITEWQRGCAAGFAAGLLGAGAAVVLVLGLVELARILFG